MIENLKEKSMKKFMTAMMSVAIMVCATLMLTACGKTISKIDVDLNDVQTTIIQGSTFDYSGIEIKVTYSDDSTETFDASAEGLTIDTSSINTNVAGTYEVVVEYANVEKTFDVTVVSGIELVTTSIPEKIVVGQTVDFASLLTVKIFNTATTQYDETLIFSVDTTNFNNQVAGIYTIGVTSGSYTASFDVEVIEGLIIDRSNVPSTIIIGSEIDWKDVLVVSVYNAQTAVYDETTNYNVDASNFNNQVAGTYTIRVTSGYTFASFSVTVAQPSSESLMAFDGDTTVIFNHATYNLPLGTYSLTLEDGTTPAPQSAYVLTPSSDKVAFQIVENGDYVLKFTKNNEPAERKFRAIDYLTLMSVGADWTDYKESVAALGTSASTFKNSVEQPYLVGTGNEFHFDLSLKNANDEMDIIADENVLNYNFYEKNGSNFDEVANLDDIVTIDGQDFTFKASTVGKTFKVIVTAKYQTYTPAEFIFTVNDGVNVFTSSELSYYFANTNIQTINLHRNIKAEITADQYNPNGSLFNGYLTTSKVVDPVDIQNDSSWLTKTRDECVAAEKFLIYNADGTLAKNYSNTPYARFSNHKSGDNLVVNGNYFNVDGRDLPLIDAKAILEAGYKDQGTYLMSPAGEGATSYAVDSQASMFYLGVMSSNYEQNIQNARNDIATNGVANATLATKADFDAKENNKATFNNLSIVSNGQVPTGDMTDEQQAEWVSRISGSYSAIKTKSDVNIENVTVRYACIGLYTTKLGADFDVNNTHVSDTWANGIYCYDGSNLKIRNSFVGASGGGAIWLEDREQINGQIFDSSVDFDETVVVDNFVSGLEPWFIAHGMNAIVPGAKVAVNGSVETLSGNTKRILDNKTNQQGAEFELFNFAIVMVNRFDVESGVDKGENEYNNITMTYTYDGTNVVRSITSMEQDYRNTPSGFAAVLDEYVNTDALAAEVTEQATIAGGALTGMLAMAGGGAPTADQQAAYQALDTAGNEVAKAVFTAGMAIAQNLTGDALNTHLAAYPLSQVAYNAMISNGFTDVSSLNAAALGTGATYTIMYNSFNNPANKYVEVMQNVTGLGELLMITEFFDKPAA